MLSAREIQVAQLISHGRYEKEIADHLNISVATVHVHARNIRQKLHAPNIAGITRQYILSYDNTIRHRIRSAYQAGRAHNACGGWTCITTDQPAPGHIKLWTRKNNHVAQAWNCEPNQAGFAHLLFGGGACSGTQNQFNMTELRKIDILQWMYSEMTLEQLETLKQIAKDLKNENTKRTRPSDNLSDAGKKN